MNSQPTAQRSEERVDSSRESAMTSAPSIVLPKGGGAMRGIGEKFATSLATGKGSLTVPIAVSPARSGFGPVLALSYDSGTGNGPFGMGWSLSLPTITRKTDKGLPHYWDDDDSDVFILSAAEDLVPVFKKNPDGSWATDADGRFVFDEELRNGYLIRRYRPRVEGLFAIVERWTRMVDGDTHWRSISKTNVLTVYGLTAESRIADPQDASRVFSWLICQSYDDKGNAIVYGYVAENDDGVDLSRISERNRVRTAYRYLKSIRYGNTQPVLIDPTQPSFRQVHVPPPDFSNAGWMFEVVFDYGEGHYQEAPPDADGRVFANATVAPSGTWPARLDSFSTYRACFEVRTCRLCRRALLFHHFSQQLGADDTLVRSTGFAYDEGPNGSFIVQVLQSGFKRWTPSAQSAASSFPYFKRSLPLLECVYSVSPLVDLSFDQLPVQEVDEQSLRDLPAGIDGRNYRWIDLDGEGIAGVLSDEGNAWRYKSNLGGGRFGEIETIAPRPTAAVQIGARQQFVDLTGDGNLDLVVLGAGAPGFYSRTDDAGWDRFRSFITLPNVDWDDPNLRWIDLTGDGHADVLITEDAAYSTWHESLAEDGFGPASRVPRPRDEEDGPRLVFSDGTQSIFLADMSGDGLTDLVRIRQSEICYWPNVGYGRFGAKVTMDHAPWLDDAGSFDQGRIRLTDTDGSGPTDVVYLGRDGIRIYLNQSGNGLSDARLLGRVPRADDVTTVSVVDFLGRGTACLLWSSPLPGDSQRPLRYLDLMGGIKPHLLTLVRNNLGAETQIDYASSTQFYLADKAAGTPWVTRLPFPVQVVTRIETRDLIGGNRFVKRFAYHHGYFDGLEREFRGFARVDQWDSEEFSVLDPAPTNADPAFDVPTTLTRTWFHTGVYLIGADLSNVRISRFLEDEYYREDGALSAAQFDAMLLDDTVLPVDLPDSDRREAIRSLKGGILRQEVYALDGTDAADRPYRVSERNYTIVPVQPRGTNLHGVFFTHARETLDFQYERALFPVLNGQIVDAATPSAQLLADPRVTHGLTFAVDDFGNVTQSAAIAYGRRFDDLDPVLTASDRARQRQLLATTIDARFTNAVLAPDAYRAPLQSETISYELVKLAPASQQAGITNLFRFDEMAAIVAQASDGAHDLPYEDIDATGATGPGAYRRPIENVRDLYRADDLTKLLPLHALETLALPGETYRLAFTPSLLSAVYQRPHGGGPSENLLPNPELVLPIDATHEADRGGYVDLDADGRWWMPSGRVFYHPDESATPAVELAEAVAHFFAPRRFRSPFSVSTFVDYAVDFLPATTRDGLDNTVTASFDYRVLQATQVTDPNGNRSFAAFDTLGLVVATALAGKSTETLGDSLADFGDTDADPTLASLQAFVADPLAQAASLLKSATTRFVYDLDRYRRCGEPTFGARLLRETHVSDPAPQGLQIQVSFAFSDGFARELQSKVRAEPGDAPVRAPNVTLPSGDVSPGALTLDGQGVPVIAAVDPRWVGKGRIVYNNKGDPIKQYEPFFSSTPLYEREAELTDTGVTPILFYDPLARVVATLHANHSYVKSVFDPWRLATWDVNDTVTLDPAADPDVGDFFRLLPTALFRPTWYDQRRTGLLGPDEKAAADKAAAHAATPMVAHFDPLGRQTITVADNGKDASNVLQKYATRFKLDIEGNQREVRDALVQAGDAEGRIVMRHDFDMLGNSLHTSSMDAGQRWALNDVTGKPIRSWDARQHDRRFEYDPLRRPLHAFVTGTDASDPTREVCYETVLHGESPGTGLSPAQVLAANLRTRTYLQYDCAGVASTLSYDFKGNPLIGTRQLLQDYKTTPDWGTVAPPLDAAIYTGSRRYDALSRLVQVVAPHASGATIHVIQPGYNVAGLLERIDAWLAQSADPTALLDPTSADLHAVTNIDYNARGQRLLVAHGNGASCAYTYDPETFRLIRLKTTGGQGTPVYQDLNYTFDPAGNVSHVRDDAQQTIYFNGQVVPPTCDYLYDPIYRLIGASGREHIGQLAQPQTTWDDGSRINLPHPGDGQAMRNYTEQYVYDAAGNFEALIHQAANGNWTRAYAYNEASLIEAGKQGNRLSNTSVGTVTEPYAYDAHGNIIGMPHLTSMQWDFKDQLSATARQVVSGTATTPETTFYTYDASGQRMRKVTERQNGSRHTERIYLGGFEIAREFDGSGSSVTLERETLHLMDDKQRVALVELRTQGADGSPAQLIRYQFGNHLGSACLELSDAAAVISYEEYFPYGSTSYQAVDQAIKAAAKRYRYTGKERDEESGFGYHGARYYAPWIGRWVSTDPKGIAGGLDLYAYARLSPIVLQDPDGLDPQDTDKDQPKKAGDQGKQPTDAPKKKEGLQDQVDKLKEPPTPKADEDKGPKQVTSYLFTSTQSADEEMDEGKSRKVFEAMVSQAFSKGELSTEQIQAIWRTVWDSKAVGFSITAQRDTKTGDYTVTIGGIYHIFAKDEAKSPVKVGLYVQPLATYNSSGKGSVTVGAVATGAVSADLSSDVSLDLNGIVTAATAMQLTDNKTTLSPYGSFGLSAALTFTLGGGVKVPVEGSVTWASGPKQNDDPKKPSPGYASSTRYTAGVGVGKLGLFGVPFLGAYLGVSSEAIRQPLVAPLPPTPTNTTTWFLGVTGVF